MSKAGLLIGVTVISIFWSGLVLKVLWGWFMVTTFELPELSIASAIGVNIVVSFMTKQYVPSDPEDFPDMISYLLGYPLIALVFGFLVHLFV